MLTIELLKDYPETIPILAQQWQDGIGRIWLPAVPTSQIVDKLQTHLNHHHLPITWVAFQNKQAVGMVSLRENDGIRPDLSPWLGSLVVDSTYRKQGIAQQLIEAVQAKTRELGFEYLYLLAFDPTIPEYYAKLGWNIIGTDQLAGHVVTVMKIYL